MSAPLLPAQVLSDQRYYRAAGLYTGKLDGVFGPKTYAAELAWDTQHNAVARSFAFAEWGGRTTPLLRTLLPVAHKQARACLLAVHAAGLHPRVVGGTRTYAEQDALYAIGNRKTRKGVVTNARGGQSRHNFGIAWDLGLFAADGTYLTFDREDRHDDDYGRLGGIWKPAGVEWGGDWPGDLGDQPHYQLALGLGTTQLREAFEGRAEWPASAQLPPGG